MRSISTHVPSTGKLVNFQICHSAFFFTSFTSGTFIPSVTTKKGTFWVADGKKVCDFFDQIFKSGWTFLFALFCVVLVWCLWLRLRKIIQFNRAQPCSLENKAKMPKQLCSNRSNVLVHRKRAHDIRLPKGFQCESVDSTDSSEQSEYLFQISQLWIINSSNGVSIWNITSRWQVKLWTRCIWNQNEWSLWSRGNNWKASFYILLFSLFSMLLIRNLNQ